MMRFIRTCVLAFVASTVAFIFSGAASHAQSSYRLAPGDVLRFEVLEDSSLNRTLLVAPDGRIAVPLVGTVVAGGQTLDTLRSDLASRLAPNFAAPPTVFVALENRPDPREETPSLIGIYVMGESRSPGRIEVLEGTTVLQFFATMGGFTNFAAQRRIQLRRGATTWGIDYRAIEAGTSDSGSVTLMDGDIFIIPQRRLFE